MKGILIFQCLVVLLLHLNAVNNAIENKNTLFRDRAKNYCRLKKTCSRRQVENYDYGNLIKISDIPDIQPRGFLVRIPFYVLAARDAHIVLSETESPNLSKDFVYEIVIGGWENSQSVIRRQSQHSELARVFKSNVLFTDRPILIIVEISIDGHIKVFTGDQTEPLAEYRDESPLPIKYFGFASWANSRNTYFYNCPPIEGHPLLAMQTNIAKLRISLRKDCSQRQVKDYDYGKLIKMSDIPDIQPKGFLVRLPLYVLAAHDAHILLSETESPNLSKDSVYEIVIGGWGNTKSVIRRKSQDMQLISVDKVNVLRGQEPVLMRVEISTDGHIQVFIEDQTEPLLKYRDKLPLAVKYFGFASWGDSLGQFFYNCPPREDHPLPAVKKLESIRPSSSSIEAKKVCFERQERNYDYGKLIKISDIPDIQPNGYLVRLPLYVRATRDAHIVLSESEAPDLSKDFVYEIVIGGWDNSKSVLRRKSQNMELASSEKVNVLRGQETVMVRVEISTDGNIKVYVEDQPVPLLQYRDRPPLDVKYFGFASWGGALNTFYFNCDGAPDSEPTTEGRPLLAKENIPPSISLRNFLVAKCNFYSVSNYEYNNFIKLSDIRSAQPDGFLARFVVYILGPRDANILLTTTDHSSYQHDYEFVIGTNNNQRIVLRRRDKQLVEVFAANPIDLNRPTKFIVEIANSGVIRLYSERLKTAPSIVFFDENILPIQYVSFASFQSQENQFFYNCSHIDSDLLEKP